jgi:chromosome segregation protein
MLRRLDIRGFKSFANPINLEFGPGVNVIVGPNGSGKSNLAEAIVWSMGEQRATRLRAAGMAEVVFSGGEGRPPAGVAEVRMTVSPAHADSQQPAESEVARRLTRAGEATYQLNGGTCRLLDIHEALGTVGLGPDALAVIRQGQVEAVCTARPSDLRAVIEEAAGVALSRRRRRRAESKLSRVAERLDRARDLATELTRRQATLERQARAAARAADLDVQIAAARQRLAANLAAVALCAEHAATAEVARCTGARDEATRAVDAAATERTAAEMVLRERLATQEHGRELVRGIQSSLERLRGRAELARERLDDAHGKVARDAGERAAAAAALGDANTRVADADARRAAAAAALAAARTAVDAAAMRREAADAGARAARTRVDDTRAAADDARRALASVDARRAHVTAERDQAAARLARLGDGDGAASPDRAERRAQISAERATRWGARADAADAAADDAQAVVVGAERRRRELAALAAAVRPPAHAPTNVLGADLEVVAGTERAFGAALGVLADAPSVNRFSSADELLDGGATAVLVPTSATPAVMSAPVGRPLAELVVGCDPGMREHLARVLAGTWLVEDLGTVPDDATGLFVTPRGDAWRPSQGIRLRTASEWAVQAEHRVALARLGAADTALAGAQDARRRASDLAARVRVRRRAAERAAAHAATALGVARAQAERMSVERADATAALDAARAELTDLDGAWARLLDAADVADRAVEDAIMAGSACAAACAAERDAFAVVELAGARCHAELAAAALAAAEADERLRLIVGRVGAPEPVIDLAGAEQAVSVLDRVGDALAEQAARLGDALDDNQHEVGDAEQTVGAARARHEDAMAMQSGAVDALHGAELALAAAQARAHELVGPHQVTEVAASDPERDPEAQAREIDDMERRRRMVGAVNELANTEFEETSERTAEITEQVADLEAAASDLAAHMQGLDDAVTDGFQQVFDVVQQRFHEAVAVLFPGGQGRLETVESDDDEPGIEIQVVPAGKRARPLAMMSGGERSLIALAFCMAIAMTRPAPFYLLDEVEAALDDTNLRRFLALVRRLARETQFVLITHQQPTVEIADTLFGVTMGRDGVSQVVSRRLGEDLAGAARPLVRRQLKAIQGGRV